MCKRKHEIIFYSFVERKSFNNIKCSNTKLLLIRIICINNYQINKKTNSNLQYTLTILPAFIQPYARKTTEKIINATVKFINNETLSLQEAALSMGAENIKSFTRYFYRILDRIDDWIIHVLKKISEITGNNNYERLPYKTKTINQKWKYFMELIHDYCNALESLSTGILLLKNNRICFMFAVLCMNIKSLGP